MGEFRMPSLGADMERGTVVEWRVAPGDVVHRGDIVAVVETEKSTIEVEIFEDGIVGELLVDVGADVPVGEALATIVSAAPSTAPAGPPPPTPPPAPSPAPSPSVSVSVSASAPSSGSGRPPSAGVHSPMIRKLAERLGVDVATLQGTGANGAVTRADVEASARTAAPTPAEPPAVRTTGEARVRATPRARRLARDAGIDLRDVTGSGPRLEVFAGDLANRAGAPDDGGQPTERATVPPVEPAASDAADLDGRRRAAVAALMSRSKREIPHYYLSSTIDLAAATDWLAEANARRGVADRLVMAALLARATVLAVAANPAMNGHWRDGRFHPSDAVHLGMAVSLRGGGLVAPTIRHAEELDLDALMGRVHDLVGRARRGVLRGSEMSEPTITVTNIGEQGVEQLFGVIYPPQVALVGFGAVVERPWAVDGMLTVRPLVSMTLSADHRASDGHAGARFLADAGRRLQRPERL